MKQTDSTTTRNSQAYGLVRSSLLGLVILTAGIAIGASVTLIATSRNQPVLPQDPEIFAQRMLRQLDHELNLSSQQRRQLDPVLQQHYRRLSEIRAEARPQIVAQLEQLDLDIVSLLDDQQSKLWKQKVESLEQQFPAFGERRRQGTGRGAGFQGQRLQQNHRQHAPSQNDLNSRSSSDDD